MSDKTDLLDKLRLDRETRPRQKKNKLLWPAAALTVLVLAGGGAFVATRADPAVSVGYAVARAPEGGKSASLLDASGYVVARRQATVAAKITARVVEIDIEEGQHVARDQIMGKLDDSNIRAALLQAQAQLRQAEANLSAARTAFADETPIFKRQQELNAKGWVATADLDEERAKYNADQEAVKVAEQSLNVAKAALEVGQRNEDDTIVRAPFDGIITVKAAQPGEMVSPISAGGGFTRTGIGTMVDMDSMEVEVDVGESFIDRVRPDQPCEVRLNAYPDQAIRLMSSPSFPPPTAPRRRSRCGSASARRMSESCRRWGRGSPSSPPMTPGKNRRLRPVCWCRPPPCRGWAKMPWCSS